MHRVDQGLAGEAARILDGVIVDRQLRTRYRTLRVMSHTAGLAATFAYVASKAHGTGQLPLAYAKVRDGLTSRLTTRGWIEATDANDPRKVLERLGDRNTDYLAASADATALLGWLARLGDALFTGEDADA
jgi:hypothetical protein